MKQLILISWIIMRAAAIERHRILWRICEGSRPEAWPAHCAVIRAVYGA